MLLLLVMDLLDPAKLVVRKVSRRGVHGLSLVVLVMMMMLVKVLLCLRRQEHCDLVRFAGRRMDRVGMVSGIRRGGCTSSDVRHARRQRFQTCLVA